DLERQLVNKTRQMEKATLKSLTDALTGLHNRDYLEKRLTELLDTERLGTLFMIDLDNFKKINDTYGHIVGDKILQYFAEVLRKYARKEDVPDKTLFIITTDGMENASKHYTYDKVRHMIERQKERYGWEFIFLGANIDAAAEAGKFGIDASMAADYHCDKAGTALNYEVISEAISTVRGCAAPLSADWKQKIDEDYKTRKKKN
ncbi:MAG: GGDEF domain-containing protein, partial [Peptococcaceae bacterium]|nr:GGDEF domain-containing protein [Peptococcaceae bacterium]